MGWLEARKARKELEKMGLDKTYLKNIGKELRQGEKGLRNQRDEMRKLESPTYRKLVKQINNITYEPSPARVNYEKSLDLIHDATLTEWERSDLLNQTESIYKDLLEASPYEQVLASLNHIKSDNLPKIHKVNNSMKLINASDMAEAQKEELLEKVKKVYNL